MEEQIKRLVNSGRTTEIVDLSHDEAKKALQERWDLENKRYKELYNFDNTDLSKYDCVVNTSTLSVEEVAEKIYDEYLNYLNSK